LEKTMHAEPKSTDEFDTPAQAVNDPGQESEVVAHSAHSLLAVLLPASPPEPKNARIVRLFDLEAAKYDPRPGEAKPAAAAQKDARRTAAREERNQSLLAAARYF
jgi:hypothetical protein